ncbi:MAG: hypothetical protein QOI82_374 [Actinomycetota bacterium]|nr:hypothetical protein [Actinomycetota bacterium]
MPQSGRPLLVLAISAAVLTATTAPTAAAGDPPLVPAPRAVCGPGAIPETGMQGRVSAADVNSGKVKNGFRCNITEIGHVGSSGGYKVERYVDKAGHECAYFDTTLLFPTNATNIAQKGTGVAVVDMANPAKPVITTTLLTPAMDSPHESLLVNQKRGLLAAVAGNPIFAPGQVDVYDLTADCRNPAFQSSTPTGVLGHEAGFAPDGKTFYAASLGGGTLTAIDLTNPMVPSIAYVGHWDTHSLSISDDGTRAYLAAGAGFPRNEVGLPAEVSGLRILDVSSIQNRALNPQPTTISTLTWPSVTIPQAELPITIGGHPYVVDIDEFATDDKMALTADGPRVGAGRIIDIADEKHPRVVSNIRLAVHQRANRAALANDPVGPIPTTSGYAGHYCAVPQRKDPGILACSMLTSGLRVFDIRNPFAPKEIAYFVAPVTDPKTPNAALSSATLVPSRKEIWYADGSSGMYVLRVTNGAWGGTVTAPATAPRPVAPPPAAPGPAPGQLPATGPSGLFGGAVLLVAAALLLRRRTRAA